MVRLKKMNRNDLYQIMKIILAFVFLYYLVKLNSNFETLFGIL